MTERLDSTLQRLRHAPADRSLERLEEEVRRQIGSRREEARTVSALAILRPIVVAVSLTAGTTAGVASMSALAAAHSATSLSIEDRLPSTLLETAR